MLGWTKPPRKRAGSLTVNRSAYGCTGLRARAHPCSATAVCVMCPLGLEGHSEAASSELRVVPVLGGLGPGWTTLADSALPHLVSLPQHHRAPCDVDKRHPAI